MFNLGFGEILVICVILIVVVGPERLPSVMKSIGKTMRTMREASREIRSTVGLDDMLRDDPPRPARRPAPPATIARTPQSLPAASAEPSTEGAVATQPPVSNQAEAAPVVRAPVSDEALAGTPASVHPSPVPGTSSERAAPAAPESSGSPPPTDPGKASA